MAKLGFQGVLSWVAIVLVAAALGSELLGALTRVGARPQGVSQAPAAGLSRATFAGGCFWCMEPPFDKLEGVVSTTSGYTGGLTMKPTYEQVSSGGTGHAEAVEVVFDPAKVGYQQLLDTFWRNIDPFSATRQFCDVGEQYRPAIFVHDLEQRRLAEASRQAVRQRFSAPVVVEILDAAPFYVAEAYHQDYYRKNPVRYRYYRWACGRDQRLAEIWDPKP
jgi:peptide-methionine (S)-S-oxide reductase